MGKEYSFNNIQFKSSASYLGNATDASNSLKESKMNMAVLELLRADYRLKILDFVRGQVFEGQLDQLMKYATNLEIIFYGWSGLLNDNVKTEILTRLGNFKEKYKQMQWCTENNSPAAEKMGFEALDILKTIDLNLMDLKQKLKMGMPTKETYTINDRAFKDLEVNRNIPKIILKRFNFDKKYEKTFQKWAEEDAKKKKITTDEDEDFSEFTEEEDED